MEIINRIHTGNALEVLKTFPDKCVNCCITSPPYYGLRDYGNAAQIGFEETPEEYVSKLVEVFKEVKRVLRDDGILWLNLGDSYCANSTGSKGNGLSTLQGGKATQIEAGKRPHKTGIGLKPKDLIGIPWAVAFALRTDGWYLRQDIIWHKPNPMPESVTDRCTKAHEYIFLLSKSAKYYYDHEAIKTEMANTTVQRLMQGIEFQKGSDRVPGKTNGAMKAVGKLRKGYSHIGGGDKKLATHSGNRDEDGNIIGGGLVNKRSVWTVTTKPFSEVHFATFPENLITDCIKAGAPENGIILDPFMGGGTTAIVASKLNRNFIGIELNPAYVKLAEKRLRKELGMFNIMMNANH